MSCEVKNTKIRPPPPPETAVVPHVASTGKEPEEPVRYSPELPVLEKFDPSTSSIVAGDWLVMQVVNSKPLETLEAANHRAP